jgi:GDP-4-dehydro-6-deoxy-D-mannose reductase
MRALITGATGFVGHWLEAHLRDQGDDVVGTGENVDVTDAAAVRKSVEEVSPEAIYHLAARTHVGASWDAPQETFTVNAIGTLNVLEAARQREPMPRVLVVSSAEVYGIVQPDELPLTEDSPLRPVSPYAASKVAAEFVALQSHLGSETPAIRVRAFNHIGPGQAETFAVARFARRIVDAQRTGERQLRIGNPEPRRDFTDVRDVVRAYRLLATSGEPGAVYNVCSGTDVAIGDVARRLIELAGADLDVVVDADLVRPVDVPVLRGDAGRIRAAVSWEPQIPLDETLRDILSHCREGSSLQ